METDAALLEQYVATGDASAFSTIARRYRQMVFATARRVTGNPHDAEDVAQTCFIELSRKAATVTTSVSGWLHSLATRRAMDTIRAAARRRRHERSVQAASAGAPSWRDLEPVIDASFETLDDELRVPMILHFLRGKNQKQISTELGLSEATVSRRLKRGIQELRANISRVGVVTTTVVLASQLHANACVIPPPASLSESLGKLSMVGDQWVKAATGQPTLGGAFFIKAFVISIVLCVAGWLAYMGGAFGWAGFSAKTTAAPYDVIASEYAPHTELSSTGFHAKVWSMASEPHRFFLGADPLLSQWTTQAVPSWYAEPNRLVAKDKRVYLGESARWTDGDRSGRSWRIVAERRSTVTEPVALGLLRGIVTLRLIAARQDLLASHDDVARLVVAAREGYRLGASGVASAAVVSDGAPVRQRQLGLVRRGRKVREIVETAPHSNDAVAAAISDLLRNNPGILPGVKSIAPRDVRYVHKVTTLWSPVSQGLESLNVDFVSRIGDGEVDRVITLRQVPASPADIVRVGGDSWCVLNDHCYIADDAEHLNLVESDEIGSASELIEAARAWGIAEGCLTPGVELPEGIVDDLLASSATCVEKTDEAYRGFTADPRVREHQSKLATAILAGGRKQ
jgi:RNA polymerase sigma factor (sigma-70 family)